MKTCVRSCSSLLGVAAVALALLAACGGGDADVDGTIDRVSGAGCSTDGTDAVAVGTFTQPIPGDRSTNVLILRSDCRWCADKLKEGGATALRSEGTWSSSRSPDGGTAIRVTKTNSQFFNLVAGDGRSVTSYRVSDSSYAGFQYARASRSSFTCDGQ